MDSDPKITLNWGCGETKKDAWVNIDTNPKCKPDLNDSLVGYPWDFPSSSVDSIFLNHVIEHTQKRQHDKIFIECNRVLKPGGILFLGYPKFERCSQAYIENRGGDLDFWEATLFGRQTQAGDFHLCGILDWYMKSKLLDMGFTNIKIKEDPLQKEYSICIAEKSHNVESYESVMGQQFNVTD